MLPEIKVCYSQKTFSQLREIQTTIWLMRSLSLVMAPVLLVSLAGCSVEEVAQTAADAAACTALTSTLNGLSDAYQAGLVDSGVIAQIDSMVGEQARELLSTGLAEDLALLGDTLSTTQSAQDAEQQIADLTASISERCSSVGVTIGE